MSGRETWEAKRGWYGGGGGGGEGGIGTVTRADDEDWKKIGRRTEEDLEGKIRGKAIRTEKIWEVGMARPIDMRFFLVGLCSVTPSIGPRGGEGGGDLYKCRRSEEVECELPLPPKCTL